MDTSNSIIGFTPNDIVNGRKIKQTELTANDWAGHIIELLDALKPRLKYMTGMSDLFVILNEYRDEDQRTRTPRKLLAALPPDFAANTRCAKLCRIPCASTFLDKVRLRNSDCKEYQGLHNHSLLITSDARLLFYHCLYNNVHSHVYVTTAIKFQEVKIDELSKLPLTQIHRGSFTSKQSVEELSLGAIILDWMTGLLRDSIKTRRQHLQELEDILQDVECKMARIDGLS